MKKTTIICILLVIMLVGCSNVEDESSDLILNDYKPMVYVLNTLYEDSGDIVNALPNDCKCIGKIERIVPQNKAMIQENFTANVSFKDNEVFVLEKNPDTIYIKLSVDDKEQYALFIKIE